MTKIIWFLALVALAASNDIQGVLPEPEGADIKVVDPIKVEDSSVPMVELNKAEPVTKFENSKDLDETVLRPIGPIFPSFLQPHRIFGPLRNGINSEQDSENLDKPKNGILTIILLKSKNDQNPDEALKMSDEEKSKMEEFKDKAENNFRTLTQFILHDMFGQNLVQQKSAQHLLGGKEDPDHFIRFSNDDRNFINLVRGDHFIGDNMPIMSDDLGRHREFSEQDPKNCNFMRFLRLKAHAHYRTIVHLLFISGLILVVLMMISLTFRINKRRRALLRLSKGNIDVSSIDSAIAKQREAEGLSNGKLLRLGSLKSTHEQKMAPPAYDQINNGKKSSLAKSLAMSYKNRYEPMTSDEEDRKSVSSLPPYEDKPKN